MSPKRPFKAVIAGGGIAGLTLANMLEKFGLDYILLEAHDEIAPAAGAAIGLMPNGSFILDQLGLYDPIRAIAGDADLEESYIRDPDGRPVGGLKHMMYHQQKRHGYPMLFFNRQWCLKELYDQLKHKKRVHLKSRVSQIDQTADGVRVTTEDGRVFTGTLVIGTDGIHSRVRQEMRRIANANHPRYFDPDEEDKVPCSYMCSFGIAQHVEGWPGSEQCFTTGKGKSFLVLSGPGRRVYWFLFVKLPKIKYGKEIPSYSKEDEAVFVKEHGHLKIRENLTFGQVYAKRMTSTLTPLHEVVFKKWFFGRMLTIGDSAHKPNPLGGMGANAAIESCAEVLNALIDLKNSRPAGLDNLTQNEVKTVFCRVQQSRHERAVFVVSFSHRVQTLMAQENPIIGLLFLRVLVPLAGQHNFFRDLSDRTFGCSRIKHLPLPSRPRVIPYVHDLPAKPLGSFPKHMVRVLFSVSMVMLLYAAHYLTPNPIPGPSANWFQRTTTTWPANPTTWLSRIGTAEETGRTLRLVYPLAQTLSPLLIFLVEGYRIGRQNTLLSLPILFTAALQYYGLPRVLPIYAILSAWQVDQTPADRAVRVEVARVFVPSLVLSQVIPLLLNSTTGFPEKEGLGWRVKGLQILPAVLFAAMTAGLSRWFAKSTPDDEHERDKHPEWYTTDDIKHLRRAYHFVFVLQAAAHIGLLLNMTWDRDGKFGFGLDLANLMVPLHCVYEWVWLDLMGARLDVLLGYLAVACHNLNVVWQLRCQGYVGTRKAVMAGLSIALGHVLVGPGAPWAALWSWREGVIAGVSVA